MAVLQILLSALKYEPPLPTQFTLITLTELVLLNQMYYIRDSQPGGCKWKVRGPPPDFLLFSE